MTMDENENEHELALQKKIGQERYSKIERKFKFTLVSFFIKTIFQITMTLVLMNRYGLIMVHDMHCENDDRSNKCDTYYEYSDYYDEFEEGGDWWVRQVDSSSMHIPNTVTDGVLDKLTLIPKKFYNNPNDMFYNEINGELNLFDVFHNEDDDGYQPITTNYKRVSCNISFNWDNIDCDDRCMEVMTKYEIDQQNGDVLICYYEMEYNPWWHNIQINIFYLLFYGLGQAMSFWYAEYYIHDYYEKNYKKKWDSNHTYTENIGKLNKEEYKKVKRQYEFYRKTLDFLANMAVNFIWCDLLAWAFNSVNGSMNLYHNILLSNSFQEYDQSYIEKMNVNLPGVFLLALSWGTSWAFLFLFWICIPTKIIFSFANIFSVFSVGFLNINIGLKTIKNLFTFEYTSYFFTPQFWYYFNVFIFPFILNFILDIDEYYDLIKPHCISMKEWVCDKMKKTELPTIELPEISVETQEVKENELQIEIREENI